MNCPNCGASWPEEDLYCSDCGCALKPDVLDTRKGSHLIPVLLLILMAVLGTIVYFAVRPAAASAPSRDTPWFTMQGTILVRFDPTAYSGSRDLIIPDTIDGVPVLSIGNSCFSGCGDLSSVTLPQGLLSIGDRAFESCTALRGIYIPPSVAEIGDAAFRNCASLEAICLTQGTQSIGSGAFDQCGSLVYILFAGEIRQWQTLYGDPITPFTYVYCNDGIFSQGGNP